MLFHNVRSFLKERIARYFLVVFIIFAAGTALGALITMIPAGRETAMRVAEELISGFAEMGLLDAEPAQQSMLIFMNNLRVGLIMTAIGIVPFLFLPLFFVIVNGLAVGLIVALFAGMMEGKAFAYTLAGLLPHGIFELPAIFLAGALGLNICLLITRKILRKGEQHESLLQIILLTAQTFLLVVLPVLLLAGLVEAFVTPVLIEMVMNA